MDNKKFVSISGDRIRTSVAEYANLKDKPVPEVTEHKLVQLFSSLPKPIRDDAMFWGWDSEVSEAAMIHWKLNGLDLIDG